MKVPAAATAPAAITAQADLDDSDDHLSRQMTSGGGPRADPDAVSARPTRPSETDAAGIRPAVLADLPSIRSLVEAAYARYADRMDRPPAPVLTDYRPAVDAGQVFVLGEPIEAVLVLVADSGALLVENVAVDPAAQGRGLGRLLMQFAEERASARGASRVTLYTNEVMTENLAIYAHLGYREVMRRAEGGYRRVFMEKRIGEPAEHEAPAGSSAAARG